MELTGSESPSTIGWNPKNQRVRHDISRARLRAIESSLENGSVWVPPAPAHRKTWEEEVRSSSFYLFFFFFLKITSFYLFAVILAFSFCIKERTIKLLGFTDEYKHIACMCAGTH